MPWVALHACEAKAARGIAAENPAAGVNKPLSLDHDTNGFFFISLLDGMNKQI